MDFNEHTYHKIQQYLDKELSAEELQAFEARLLVEKELAAEVNLHQEMNSFLAETPENKLRKNLDQLSQEFSDSPKKKTSPSNSWRWLLPLLLVGSIGIFYLINSNNTSTLPIIAAEKENPNDSDSPLIYPSIPPFDSLLINWNPPKQINEYEWSVYVQDDLDYFKTNLTLDRLIKKNHTEEHFKITFEQQPSDTIWIEESVKDQLTATIQTTIDLMDQPFFISLYNNSYDEIRPHFNHLKPYKSNATEPINLYRIDLQLGIEATTSPGLYYYVLHGNEKYHAGKIVVLKKEKSKTIPPVKKATPPTPKEPQKKTIIYASEDKEAPSLEPEDMTPPIVSDHVYHSVETPTLAANFDPNPALDLLVENNTRSGNFNLSVINLTKDLLVTPTNQSVNFQFEGQVESDENLLKKQFSIHFFSNDPTAYQNFSTLQTSDFNLKESKKDTYSFDFQQNLTLEPGLYYFLIENKETERIHFVEKIEVREDE